MNPYDFIPLGQPSQRKPPPGHHRLEHGGGTIRARLTTLGPFLIAEQNQWGGQNAIRPMRRGEIIPGSSLKGMLRTITEIVGGGCISLSGSLYPRGQYDYRAAQEPKDFKPCDDMKKLCVTCRMFGALHRGNAWKGLIEPGEAIWLGNGTPPTVTYDVIVGQPKPSHSAFYVKDGSIRGRKAYFHHPEQIIRSAPAHQASFGSRQTIQVQSLEPGQIYEFTLRHEGLDDDAYALLLYTMFLEDGLAHKLGWGKPMGFGSVKIEPFEIEEIDLHARYRRGGDEATKKYEGDALVEYVQAVTMGIREREDDVIKDFRRIFSFPGSGETYQYPNYSWFKDNPTASLEELNQTIKANKSIDK